MKSSDRGVGRDIPAAGVPLLAQRGDALRALRPLEMRPDRVSFGRIGRRDVCPASARRPDRRVLPHFAARSWSAYFSRARATLASGSIRAGVHSSPQRTANAAASRSRSSIKTHAASWCGSK
jgi:hypothetical protein